MSKVICPHYCSDCFAEHVCAVHAIDASNGSVEVNTERCIGCGSCKAVCVALGYKALQNKMPVSFMKSAA